MSDTVEASLPENSIIRKLLELQSGQLPEGSSNVKEVETTISDEDYNIMLNEFLKKTRQAQENAKPENKLRRKIVSMEEHRKKAQFRDIKKGFLTF